MLRERDVAGLYMKASTELPPDVFRALEKAVSGEEGAPKEILERVLENASLAREGRKPICQDTGTPIFYVESDGKQSEREIREIIERATDRATMEIPLRPNAVDPVSGEVKGNVPVIHYRESGRLRIDLLMKGGGSENVTSVYSLPDERLEAGRDMEGVRRCVLDAVMKAQGKGCPPYVIGVAIGGSVEEVSHLSKRQLLRRLDDRNEDRGLAKAESGLERQINMLGIGPAGLGGKTTALGVKISKSFRHPASFFVGVAFSCWALRRASYD